MESAEAAAMSQVIDLMHMELEERSWYENHAFRLIEYLESVTSGPSLFGVLERMMAITEQAVPEGRSLLLLQDHPPLGPALPRQLLAWIEQERPCQDRLTRTQGQFPGESVACFDAFPEHLGAFTCWSAPLGSSTAHVQGTYSLIFAGPRKLTRREQLRLEQGARLLGLAAERYLLHSQLQKSEQHFRRLVVDSQVAICSVDAEGHLLYANPAWLALTGLTPVSYHQPLKSLLPEKCAAAIDHLLELRRQGSTQSVEIELGQKKIFITGGSLEGSSGSLQSWVDVTDEHQLKFQNLRLAAALEQSSDGVLIIDACGRIEYSNAALTRALGFTTEELLGAPLQAVFEPPMPYAEILERVERHQSWTGNMKANRRNGSLYIGETVISALRPLSGSGVNLLFSCRDVTREVELEEQVRLSQKMEAVGLLAGGVAHDFNNMLQAIAGYADLCRERQVDPEERDEMLVEILRATERAGQLTKQLLAFARKKAPLRGQVELGVTVANLLGMTSRLIGPDIRVVWTPPPEPLSVLVDASQIEQVLMNLCVNARDAMPEGGTLRVSVFRAVPSQFLGDMCDNCAVLEVSDTGIGIESSQLARLFEPFFSTKQNGKGTGLGLSVVYGIVQAHEGWIDVKSSPGEGSCFRIFLPLTSLPQGKDRSNHQQVTHPSNQRTLLVVDDDPRLVEIAVRVFERAGYRVLTASNGVEAEATFREHQAQIDGVLLDLIMPKRGGLETWQIIDELSPGHPVVFCSGYMRDAQDKIPCRDTIGVVSKPYSVQRLVDEMKRVISNAVRVPQG